MEALLNSSDTSSLHILCEKNEKRYLDILRYYLPFYLQEITEFPQFEEIGTSLLKVNFSTINVKDSKLLNLPIQVACLSENVTLLDFVHKFFANQPYTPRYLDMEYQDETTGDNCVLLACRYAKYKLIVFFHKTCKLNFRVKNNFGHNAINVLLAGASKMYSKSYFNCLRYLIEVVGVDCEYNYQYSLSISEQPEIVEYLEMKLREIGIYESKKEVEIRTRGVSCDKKMSTNETYDTIQLRDTLSQLKFRSVSDSVFQD